ncbi:MAG: hypothetical protein U0527_10175 [Candidatus Eisenbacteria bacterium]
MAASYEARKLGIHLLVPMARAERLAFALVRSPANFEKYRDVSRQVMAILAEFSLPTSTRSRSMRPSI